MIDCRLLLAFLILLLASLPVVAVGQAGAATEQSERLGSGYAGVYPDVLDGRITASGARFDGDLLAASHRTLPLGSLVRVVNLRNGESVNVRIIDRGPFSGDRIMDLSEKAAAAIGMGEGDEEMVRIERAGSAREGRDNAVRVAEYGAKTWTGSTGFTVQLGSFSTKEAAEAVRARVLGSWIMEVDLEGQRFYRLNYGRYRSAEDAAADIDTLEGEGFFGFVKSVEESDN